MLFSIEDFDNQLSTDSDIKRALKHGCIVDTNVLFAASYPSDKFNKWTEKAFKLLHKYKIPIYTNINVRFEFLELYRREIILKGLLRMFDNLKGSLDGEIKTHLEKLKDKVHKARSKNKPFKFRDEMNFRFIIRNELQPSKLRVCSFRFSLLKFSFKEPIAISFFSFHKWT
jgi:predicted nucleic acid-binding protein